MRTETAKRILKQTPQEIKDKVREETDKYVKDMKETREQLALWYYKKYVEGVPLTQDEVIESFLAGFNSAEKRIKDRINAYKSQLKGLKTPKLTKRIDEDKIKELEIRIDTLNQLL